MCELTVMLSVWLLAIVPASVPWQWEPASGLDASTGPHSRQGKACLQQFTAGLTQVFRLRDRTGGDRAALVASIITYNSNHTALTVTVAAAAPAA